SNTLHCPLLRSIRGSRPSRRIEFAVVLSCVSASSAVLSLTQSASQRSDFLPQAFDLGFDGFAVCLRYSAVRLGGIAACLRGVSTLGYLQQPGVGDRIEESQVAGGCF